MNTIPLLCTIVGVFLPKMLYKKYTLKFISLQYLIQEYGIRKCPPRFRGFNITDRSSAPAARTMNPRFHHARDLKGHSTLISYPPVGTHPGKN